MLWRDTADQTPRRESAVGAHRRSAWWPLTTLGKWTASPKDTVLSLYYMITLIAWINVRKILVILLITHGTGTYREHPWYLKFRSRISSEPYISGKGNKLIVKVEQTNLKFSTRLYHALTKTVWSLNFDNGASTSYMPKTSTFVILNTPALAKDAAMPLTSIMLSVQVILIIQYHYKNKPLLSPYISKGVTEFHQILVYL